MIKELKINTPLYENIKVGEITETKWETSDGKQFDDEQSADRYEFYNCKVRQRGHNLPVMRVEIFDFSCLEDIERYEKDYIYLDCIKKYDKNTMIFPNTYVMYEEYDPEFEYDDMDNYCYDTPDTHVYFVTLDEYKRLLIEAIQNLK